MCGICGIFDLSGAPVGAQEVRPMMEVMRHRGPDDEGVLARGAAALGHVRLSIIDLSSAGHQPMLDKTGRYAIAYNGEIYNYIEIKRDLEGKHRFRTHTDTEVLLHAYMEWGEACLDRLNGMFAFLILDLATGHVFGARDRFGVKPFYYVREGDRLLVASEIPPLLKVLREKPPQNEQAVFDFLAFNRTDQGEETFFRGITKLPHGSTFSLRGGDLTIRPWYRLRDRIGRPFASPEAYRDMLADSVALRLRSDVPVGVCLSGGLDSSAVVSLLLQSGGPKEVETFSAVYGEGEQGDESSFIREFEGTAARLHFTTPSGESLLQDMDRFVLAHGEPVPTTSPYAQFKVMDLARSHVTVLLDGQGADEQLAGYPYFFGAYFKELLKGLRWITLAKEMAAYWGQQQSLYGVKAMAFFLMGSRLQSCLRSRALGFLRPGFANRGVQGSRLAENLYGAVSLRDCLLDHFEYKLEHLLKWEDRNSMAFSLESRVPFLDFRVVEGTLSLPSDWIIRRGWTKWILRESLEGVLPERIRLRTDKVGFETPQDRWFREPAWQTYVGDLLSSKGIEKSPYLDRAKCTELYRKHLMGQVNAGKEIWKWIHLQRWQDLVA